jgi:hypothetical protein
LIFGFKKSFSQSPTKLRLKTVIKIANPGKVTVHQACRIYILDEPIMYPQLMTLGSPRPKKLSPASKRMAMPTAKEALTIIGGRALGRISRQMIRIFLAPIAFDAVTKSLSRRDINSTRNMRAIPGQADTLMARMIDHREGLKGKDYQSENPDLIL